MAVKPTSSVKTAPFKLESGITIQHAVEVDWERFGAYFAGFSSDVQALFFKGMFSRMDTWPAADARMQLLLIVEALRDLPASQYKKVFNGLMDLAGFLENS